MKEMDFSRDFLPPISIDDPPIYISRKLNPGLREIADALLWYRAACGDDGRLRRKDFRPESLRRLMYHASLFDIVKDGSGRAVDLHTRVFSGAMARIYGEIGSAPTSEKLPPVVQQRFLFHVNAMLEANDAVMSHTQVSFSDKTYIAAEGLILPIWKEDEIVQCLNFFSFR
ncbi:MAG: hypothetical protein Kow00104_16310 [Rhodothalassiaceae bacterium]